MNKITSSDGTTIAFDVWGDGQPLIMIDGATAYRALNPTNAEVGQLLREELRVYAYDRRGRGESTDTAPYAVEREIEDLAALIADAAAPSVVFGWSSGAVLALDAAAAGLPITRLADGVPYVALPPEGEGAPLVVAWHLHDPPRSERAMAAVLPLKGLPAWRVYLGLPLSGSRLPEAYDCSSRSPSALQMARLSRSGASASSCRPCRS